MRSSRAYGLLKAPTILCLIALSSACYDPAVRERVLMDFAPDGEIHLTVVTSFRQGKDLAPQERDEIRNVVDLYELGRDPWLRGFKRAEAREVVNRREGSDISPGKIVRQATLPSVESFVEAMPDPIANFKLRKEAKDGTVTLSIVHIDLPESLRENRRRLEREIEALSSAAFRLSQRQCDLYDYLSGHPDRRAAVFEAIASNPVDPNSPGPESTVPIEERLAVEAFQSGLEGIDPFSGRSEGRSEGDSQDLAIARMAFSAFDFDFCVRIPGDAVDISSSGGMRKSADSEEPNTWCTERLVTDDLMEELWAESEPPMTIFDQKDPLEPDVLAAFPFTCRRHEDESTVARAIWNRVLPRPYYELTWRRPAAAGPATSE